MSKHPQPQKTGQPAGLPQNAKRPHSGFGADSAFAEMIKKRVPVNPPEPDRPVRLRKG